jgi:hypothetical protein
LGELFTWGVIVALCIAAFAVLQLEKHWYRAAQVLFTLATLFAVGRLGVSVWDSSNGLSGGIAFTLAIFAIWANIWFVQKVEADVPKQPSRITATEGELRRGPLAPSVTEHGPPLRPGQIIDQRARHLSPLQKGRLVEILKQQEFPPPLCLRYKNYDREACQYVSDFREVFNEAGWTRIEMQWQYADYDHRRGLFIETMWNHITPSGAHVLAKALRDVGLTVTLKTSRTVRREDDVVFFVGAIED